LQLHDLRLREKYEKINPQALASLVQEFPEGGYIILRNSGGSISQRTVFDVGPLGLDAMSSHGHADALSFILDAAGESLLIDSGTFTSYPTPLISITIFVGDFSISLPVKRDIIKATFF
jgi:hypothetical protein